jgi:HPt (histidine-containing phosphotransfer) domain-containing protein
MPPTKAETPAVTTYADYEVITPPNKLRNAVSQVDPNAPEDDPVARAEQALAQLSPEFAGWMDTECERLDLARHQVKAKGFIKQTREDLFHAAHDIKGESATFGFPAVAAAAESLCRLIEHTPDATRIPLTLVDQHGDAVRAIIREYARSDANEVAAVLTKRLREVTDEFLAQENKHRPDYLEGILAPPLAPGETY